jgi:hypothetical protein
MSDHSVTSTDLTDYTDSLLSQVAVVRKREENLLVVCRLRYCFFKDIEK